MAVKRKTLMRALRPRERDYGLPHSSEKLDEPLVPHFLLTHRLVAHSLPVVQSAPSGNLATHFFVALSQPASTTQPED